MDESLVAWARRVKARRGPGAPPPLWLFTDPERLPDPLPAVARLPAGLCGVVLRHDAAPDRVRLGRALARLCRQHRLLLSVAGDWRLAARLGAGLHLRGGRVPHHATGRLPRHTASAHTPAEARRAWRAGAALVFVSPVFATASHPGGKPLGVVRWTRIAAHANGQAAALGGIAGRRARALPGSCRAVGAVGALGPGTA